MRNMLETLAIDIAPSDVGIPDVKANDVFTGGLNAVYIAGGIACVIVIIVAGILYALSAGDSNQIKIAKNAILYAIVGLVVIMMAFVITAFVIGQGTK